MSEDTLYGARLHEVSNTNTNEIEMYKTKKLKTFQSIENAQFLNITVRKHIYFLHNIINHK